MSSHDDGNGVPDQATAMIQELRSALRKSAEREEKLQSKIALRDEQIEELTKRIGKDPLTGLGNRYALGEKFRELARFSPDSLVTLILIDVNKFKSINDTYGHTAGDAVLVRIATILKEEARPSDTIYRYGGDEIVIVGEARHARTLADIDIEKFLEAVARFPQAVKSFGWDSLNCWGEGVRVPGISISLGVTADVYSQVHEAYSEESAKAFLKKMIAKADEKMYLAKHSGKDFAASTVIEKALADPKK